MAVNINHATDTITATSGTLSLPNFLGLLSYTTTATSKTLSNNEICTVTASSQTITLPSSPTTGSMAGVSIAGTFTDTVIGRNSANIMSLAEDMTINVPYVSVTFVYIDATRGWRIF
jgi:hypothetical protein